MIGNAPVLIVSASAGTGHVRAGEALHMAFTDQGAEAEHVDVLSLGRPWVRRVYGGGFELLAARAPRLWGELYEWSDGPAGDVARWGPIAARVLFREFRRLLRSRPWRCCVCTHFLPSQLAAGRPGLPSFTLVMTDFALHRYWVQSRVRRYFVPSAQVEHQLRERMPGSEIVASGIPVAPVFNEVPSCDAARTRLSLDPSRAVALVMGGGLGVGVDARAIAALNAMLPDLQVLAVCGRNRHARERLEALRLPASRLRVFGHVDGMAQFYAAADVVITKPGGLTCSEALAVGRPLILTRPIPGHERANAEYLVRQGVALLVGDDAALATALQRVFREPGFLLALSRSARATGAPEAAAAIARTVLRRDALSAVA